MQELVVLRGRPLLLEQSPGVVVEIHAQAAVVYCQMTASRPANRWRRGRGAGAGSKSRSPAAASPAAPSSTSGMQRPKTAIPTDRTPSASARRLT